LICAAFTVAGLFFTGQPNFSVKLSPVWLKLTVRIMPKSFLVAYQAILILSVGRREGGRDRCTTLGVGIKGVITSLIARRYWQ
jgi:hypothetical protein